MGVAGPWARRALVFVVWGGGDGGDGWRRGGGGVDGRLPVCHRRCRPEVMRRLESPRERSALLFCLGSVAACLIGGRVGCCGSRRSARDSGREVFEPAKWILGVRELSQSSTPVAWLG